MKSWADAGYLAQLDNGDFTGFDFENQNGEVWESGMSRYRFEPEIIEKLLIIDYNKLIYDIIISHIDQLYEELIDLQNFEWLPIKSNINKDI